MHISIYNIYAITALQISQLAITLTCLNIGTPNTINFPFGPNGKFMVIRVPILQHIRVNFVTVIDLAVRFVTANKS